MSSKEGHQLRPLAMPPRVAVVDKAELLKRYLESNKPVYLDPGKLDVESVAIAAKDTLKGFRGLAKLSVVLTAMAEEANPTYNNPHFRIVTTEIHVATGKVTATMVTATMEPTCLQMQVIGRELYSQYTSLMHPKTNNGLGPTLVAGQAGSLKALKGVDFTMNTYMTELCFLANPTSNHAPFTEPGKIDMNSLALLNIKKTREAIDSLSMICAVHAYILTHALSLLTMDNTFLTSAKPAIQNITTLYFSSVLLDEDGLLPDDDLLHALHACVLEHMLEQLSATKDVEPGKRFQDVTVAASGVVVSFFCSHVGRVTEGFDTMGAVDRWIGVMSDTLSGTFRNSRQNYSPDDTTLLDPAACEVYAIVRKDLGISFDKYGKEDVGKRVGAIYEAIRGGKFGGLGG